MASSSRRLTQTEQSQLHFHEQIYQEERNFGYDDVTTNFADEDDGDDGGNGEIIEEDVADFVIVSGDDGDDVDPNRDEDADTTPEISIHSRCKKNTRTYGRIKLGNGTSGVQGSWRAIKTFMGLDVALQRIFPVQGSIGPKWYEEAGIDMEPNVSWRNGDDDRQLHQQEDHQTSRNHRW